MKPTHLAIFDFDNTLFRSPHKPPDWPQGRGWWGRPESLSEPCVPEEPTEDWWNTDVVGEARRMLDDPDTLTVLLTGRLASRFASRVSDLLEQASLDFDEVHLGDEGGTLDFKLDRIRRILDERPELSSVTLWDDREEHLPAFAQLFDELQISYRLLLVESDPKGALC